MQRQLFAFDLDDTCTPASVYYHIAIVNCIQIILRALGRACPHPKDLIDYQQKLDIKRMTEHVFHPDRFPGSWAIVYEHFAHKSGLTPDPQISQQIFTAACRFREGPFYPLSGVIDTLTTLRDQGHKLFIISAGEKAEDLQCRKIKEAGLDQFFPSDHIFITGPDKTPAMKKVFNGDRSKSWMIGDSIRHDIRPAKRLGIKTVWIPSNSWSFYRDDRVKPHFTIHTLPELLELIL